MWNPVANSNVGIEPRIAIITPVNGPVSMSWALAVRQMDIPMPWKWICQKGLTIDVARNVSVREALEIESVEYLFFLDLDVIPLKHTLMALLQWKLPICTGLYWSKHVTPKHPRGMWCFWVDVENEEPLDLSKIPQGISLVKGEAAGLGCCLVHRKVFEKLLPYVGDPPCWFRWEYDPDKKGDTGMSEDLYFFKLVRDKLDIPVYADIHIRCPHVVGSHGIAFKENGELIYVL